MNRVGSNDKGNNNKITVRRRRTAPVRQADFESGSRFSRSHKEIYGTAASNSLTQAYFISILSDFCGKNQKYDPSFQVSAEKLSAAVYSPADFRIEPRTEWLPETPTATPRPRAQQGPCRISQSERDWAETLNRLQHGENPAAVQEWLERKRQDKHDPVYYSALTVRKAVAELERRRAASIEAEIS